MRARGLLAAAMTLLATACASNAGSGTRLGIERTTSTVERTTTTAPPDTTARPTTTVPPTTNDRGATDGDLAVCAHADDILAGFEPSEDPEALQNAVVGMLVDGWQADDAELAAAVDAVRTGVAESDVAATSNAIDAYYVRCAALGGLG
jgi:hypothetical protein